MDKQPDNHFFASSIASWYVTTPERDLRQLLKIMDKEGYPYNLYLVPGSWDSDYKINYYAPQVEGTQWVGFFEADQKKGKRNAAAR